MGKYMTGSNPYGNMSSMGGGMSSKEDKHDPFSSFGNKTKKRRNPYGSYTN